MKRLDNAKQCVFNKCKACIYFKPIYPWEPVQKIIHVESKREAGDIIAKEAFLYLKKEKRSFYILKDINQSIVKGKVMQNVRKLSGQTNWPL